MTDPTEHEAADQAFVDAIYCWNKDSLEDEIDTQAVTAALKDLKTGRDKPQPFTRRTPLC